MSINHERINRLTASELRAGAPVFTQDGKHIGDVGDVYGGSFKVDARLQRDYWLDLTYVTHAADDAVTMSFEARELGAYKLNGPVEEQDEETLEHEVLLAPEEQRAQREQMTRELAEQRRGLPNARPEGEAEPPDTRGTIGEPVEAELERMESGGPTTLEYDEQRRALDEDYAYDEDVVVPESDEDIIEIVVAEGGSERQAQDDAELAARAGVPYGRDSSVVDPTRSDTMDPMARARMQALDAAEHGYGFDTSRGVALAQSALFIAGGLWPVLNRRSFEAVTGAKHDFWVVKTVGLLLTAAGATLGLAARRGRAGNGEMRVLGVGTAAALLAIDLTYVAKRRISKVYLLDAAAQLALIGGWLAASMARRGSYDDGGWSDSYEYDFDSERASRESQHSPMPRPSAYSVSTPR
jgi:hypothetical protein